MIESSRSARIGIPSLEWISQLFYQKYMTEDVMYAGVYFGCTDQRYLFVRLLFSLRQHGTSRLYLCSLFAGPGKKTTQAVEAELLCMSFFAPRGQKIQAVEAER